MLGPPRYYNIVAVGAMNPRIHTPLWYRLIDCLTEDQERAIKEIVVIPGFARFASPEYIIHCAEDRWEVATFEEKYRERILGVACKVFEKLNETPVSAIGFNTVTNLQIAKANVPKALGKLGFATGFSLSNADETDCTFGFSRREPFRVVVANVAASPIREDMVLINYNTHIDFKPVPGYRNMTPDFIGNFEPHEREAKSFAEKIVNRISEVERT